MRRPRRAGARGGDSGSATIWLLSLLCLVGFAATAALAVAGAIAARHRAEAAADLAALAAAGRLLLDPAQACAHAADIASAQGATLRSCVIRADALEDSVEVEVTAPSPSALIPGLPAARARARAGPVTAPL